MNLCHKLASQKNSLEAYSGPVVSLQLQFEITTKMVQPKNLFRGNLGPMVSLDLQFDFAIKIEPQKYLILEARHRPASRLFTFTI